MPKSCSVQQATDPPVERQGISRLTAMIIHTNKVSCEAGQHNDGLWVGWIALPEKNHRPLISTNPRYTTKESAIQDMERLVADIRHFMDKE